MLPELTLSDGERDQLARWVRRRKSAQDLALCSRIVLECATGVSDSEVSRRLSVSLPTVRKWRARFLERRLDGLVDEPRPGRSALIGVDRVEQVVVDPLFTEKVSDVVGLYLNPPESAVVLSVDEKSQVQALARSQPVFPMMPGRPRAAHARLRAARHDEPGGTSRVRGSRRDERCRWDGDLLGASQAPIDRVQEVPPGDRQERSRPLGRACRLRQLLHP